MQEAIKRAIEGGYKNQITEDFLLEQKTGDTLTKYDYALTLIDPEFWKCLGKAEGWGEMPSGDMWQGKNKWIYQWHNFIDHLAEGKDIESYFKKLLK